jgi:hypothetical protein
MHDRRDDQQIGDEMSVKEPLGERALINFRPDKGRGRENNREEKTERRDERLVAWGVLPRG